MTDDEPGLLEVLAPILLALVFLASAFFLGLHARLEIGLGLSIGTFDLLIGAGFLLAAGWVPWVLADDPRQARILMLSTYLAFGVVVLATS